MSLARTSSLAVGAAVALVLTSGAAASAATPIGTPMIQSQPSLESSNSNCTPSPQTSPGPITPVVNGPAKTVASTVSGTVTNGSDGTDVSTVSVSTVASVKMTATSTYPSAISVSFTGNGSDSLASGHTTTVCDAEASAVVVAGGKVTLPTPGLVTITTRANGSSSVAAIFGTPSAGFNNAALLVSALPGSTATETVFMPAGTYQALTEGGAALTAHTTTSQTGSGSASITFTPGGARTAGPAGNGAGRYVVMSGARTCSTHTLASHVVLNKKLAAQVKTATVLGNGAVLKRVTAVHAGSSLTVKLPDSKTEKVVINLVLRSGKHLTINATYLRCS